MKTPRVYDFDPNAKVPELASPLDNLPPIKPPTKKQMLPSIQRDTENATHSPLPQEHSVFFNKSDIPEPSNARTPERSNVRRSRRRASYELYTDQIEAIQRLALEEKLQGGTGNQSEMVREAIDEYLRQKRGVK